MYWLCHVFPYSNRKLADTARLSISEKVQSAFLCISLLLTASVGEQLAKKNTVVSESHDGSRRCNSKEKMETSLLITYYEL